LKKYIAVLFCDYGPDGYNAVDDIALVGPLIGRSKSSRR
jgi:hypothetical protein